jgi:hypothetical protein
MLLAKKLVLLGHRPREGRGGGKLTWFSLSFSSSTIRVRPSYGGGGGGMTDWARERGGGGKEIQFILVGYCIDAPWKKKKDYSRFLPFSPALFFSSFVFIISNSLALCPLHCLDS